MTPDRSSLTPGFIALHGNRLEDLARVLGEWLARYPLAPLEPEIILVQSHGVAEWLKMELARLGGVCAAVRVELPGGFLWRTYRQVLGPRAVPRESPLDKVPMTWRLMQVLPGLLDRDAFGPLRGYLREDEPQRRLQLAAHLADLFDQYQNYRVDWLEAWARGEDLLLGPDGGRLALPAGQVWQAHLWRAVLGTLDPHQAEAIRPRLHRRAIRRLQGPEPPGAALTRRVLAFGMSHMPGTVLDTLAALARHSQVMLAIPNPCRYYWADIMEGRELLRSQRRRQPARTGPDLGLLALAEMHRHAHPLLAAWGRQGRDFIRQLDVHDDAEATLRDFDLARIDLFDTPAEDAATPLLQRVQRRILDLEPVPLEPEPPPPPGDRSILFQVAHGPVRELEVLQDQLLAWLAERGGPQRPLDPRDCVVMVPDIAAMAPAIRAVFGQYPRGDARSIPFDIADLEARSGSTLIGALTWVLRLPQERVRLSELLDLLEVPAVAARFGVGEEALPLLARWMEGAGIRWGLDGEHRGRLGLGAAGGQNSAWFGLRRLLLGYASGGAADLDPDPGPDRDPDPDLGLPWAGIEPYGEIGGLDAGLAGSLAHLLQVLLDWEHQCRGPHPPADWIARARALLHALFRPVDEGDAQALAALDEALTGLGLACDQAGFDAPLALPVFREAWLEVLEAPAPSRRFRAGGLTFCTLMPMRAVPFEVVCLVGMNDGDFPRRTPRSDFDLMGLPGQGRPGDRSRQLDDRQLMLEALLSARRHLYVSWTGRSVRDNSTSPPSVLVAQLRDYLAAVWGPGVLAERTLEHPLQPFSRSYFEAGSGLWTCAREWRGAHGSETPAPPDGAPGAGAIGPVPAFVPDPAAPLDLTRLARFLKNPVRVYFRERLGVAFQGDEEACRDLEPFDLEGLERYHSIAQQLRTWPPTPDPAALLGHIDRSLGRLRRAGALPIGGFGDLEEAALAQTLGAMARAWTAVRGRFPQAQGRVAVGCAQGEARLEDWVDGLYGGEGRTVWLQLVPHRLLGAKAAPRADRLLDAWVRTLALAAAGQVCHGLIVGQDGTLTLSPVPQDQAEAQLQDLLALWLAGMNRPLPLPVNTALAVAGEALGLTTQSPRDCYEAGRYRDGEGQERCLARLYPDYETLAASGDLHALAPRVYGPMLAWVKDQVSAAPHGDLGQAEAPAT